MMLPTRYSIYSADMCRPETPDGSDVFVCVGGWVGGHPMIARKAELAMPSALNPAPAAAVRICGPPPLRVPYPAASPSLSSRTPPDTTCVPAGGTHETVPVAGVGDS